VHVNGGIEGWVGVWVVEPANVNGGIQGRFGVRAVDGA
jgi:hypothetical protein